MGATAWAATALNAANDACAASSAQTHIACMQVSSVSCCYVEFFSSPTLGSAPSGGTAAAASKTGFCYSPGENIVVGPTAAVDADGSGDTNNDYAVAVEVPGATVCTAKTTGALTADVTYTPVWAYNNADRTTAVLDDSSTWVDQINSKGIAYCSCYTASSSSSSSSTTGSNMFAIGFSLLAILASLWK